MQCITALIAYKGVNFHWSHDLTTIILWTVQFNSIRLQYITITALGYFFIKG